MLINGTDGFEVVAAFRNCNQAVEEVAALRADVARAVGNTSRLDAATRARTEDANLRRIVRERFGVPRLSLF